MNKSLTLMNKRQFLMNKSLSLMNKSLFLMNKSQIMNPPSISIQHSPTDFQLPPDSDILLSDSSQQSDDSGKMKADSNKQSMVSGKQSTVSNKMKADANEQSMVSGKQSDDSNKMKADANKIKVNVNKMKADSFKSEAAVKWIISRRQTRPNREIRTRRMLYLDLTGFLREWAEHTFGSPVHFPLRSREHALLRYYLSQRPSGVPRDSRRTLLSRLQQGNPPLQIALPVLRWKPYPLYDYLPPKGCLALKGSLKALFEIALWNDMEPHLYGLPHVVNREVSAWCTRHGISIDNEAVVLKHYRRMQCYYALVGLPVRPKQE